MEINQSLRDDFKNYRKSLSPKDKRDFSNKLCLKLYSFIRNNYEDVDNFLCYYPLEYEVDLRPLYAGLLSENKYLYFPVSNPADCSLSFYRVTDLKSDFSRGNFGVMEPFDTLPKFSFDKKTICFTPGLIFDNSGKRVGYGKGYYDRFFAQNMDLIKIAACFEGQLVDALETSSYDVPMDYIFTNNDL
ncbi:MAG: 5-formyltetrahydrofolate cyclo-ligase [Pseudobutyrivibrio sp.]|nr:5-formyltetrahydrofolate cyclo-ligase [Pseudobutyrivibrio sp.]